MNKKIIPACDRLSIVLKTANTDAVPMSINYFARLLGLSRGEYLYVILRGEEVISLDLAIRIHAIFPEFNIEWLIGVSEQQQHTPFAESIIGKWKYVTTNNLSPYGIWTEDDCVFKPFGYAIFKENGILEEPEEEPGHEFTDYAFSNNTGQLCFRDMQFVVIRLTKDTLEYVDASYKPIKYILERCDRV